VICGIRVENGVVPDVGRVLFPEGPDLGRGVATVKNILVCPGGEGLVDVLGVQWLVTLTYMRQCFLRYYS